MTVSANCACLKCLNPQKSFGSSSCISILTQ